MNRYLLHLTPAGYPVGIHSQEQSVYLPTTPKDVVEYGEAVVRARGSQTSWDAWCAQLAEQGQSRARWVSFTSRSNDMEQLLISEQSSAQYSLN